MDKQGELEIAEHACLKHSGRVGRLAAAKSLDADAIHLAVIALIRHAETDYDRLLADDYERQDAHIQVAAETDEVLERWKLPV